MKNITGILYDYLVAHKALEPRQLGLKAPAAAAVPATAESQAALIERLKDATAFNNNILKVIVGVYLVVLAAALAFAWYYRTNADVLTKLLGGSVFSMLIIAYGLTKLWREVSASSVLISILPSLSPAEAVRAIQNYYFATATKSKAAEVDVKNFSTLAPATGD